ncbi:deleted in malignant brain tumors 1 protein [Ictalurus punctatus]|uniref:Deleted in malignant brain tumors 1 protein n=1 Tax=Ictalurus punctatus TaxID=7998 RepID=A0A9F7TS99_ICTPU|nr:deleted in malignant brain tumors 1 protein [Ictalurus punctatus]
MKDAAVVCRELRCGEPVEVQYDAHFGEGSEEIWIHDLYCRGYESTLNNCSSQQGHSCDYIHNAGVICSGENLRLSAGPHRCSGRVEVLHGGSWSTVCDADFDQQDAEVVCRELGCGIPVKVLGSAAFGRGEGQVWTEELQCRGNESEITFCPTSSSLKHSNCSHYNDVGLICSGSVRLMNGGSRCAGRVEVLQDGQWGTVCGLNWDKVDAAVLCRELHCGEPVDAPQSDQFGEGSGPIWMVDVHCKGSESTLKNCRSSGMGYYCGHDNDAGVTCSGKKLN